MNLDHLKSDFATVVDGLETVRMRFPAGDKAAGPDVRFNHALRRPLKISEQSASRGTYQAGDMRFTLAAAESEIIPGPGCLIIDSSDQEFTVLDCSIESLRSVYVCTGRNLVISERLDTLITVQEASFIKGAGGAQEIEGWSDLYTGVRARIQPTGGTETQQHGRRIFQRHFTVFLREPFVLRRQHRIVGPDGMLYRVTGFSHPEKIDRLTEITCEEFQGGP